MAASAFVDSSSSAGAATFEVDGLRADIVTARTAVAHAAWEGRDEVTRADIRRAALLALPHRRRRNPFDAPGLDEDLLNQILGDDELPPEPPEGPTPDEPPTSPEDNTQDQAQGDGQRDEAADGDSDQAPVTDDTPPESDGEPPVTFRESRMVMSSPFMPPSRIM